MMMVTTYDVKKCTGKDPAIENVDQKSVKVPAKPDNADAKSEKSQQ